MSIQAAEREATPGIGTLLAAFEPLLPDDPEDEGLYCGPVRLVVQAPDIRNDYKKCAGSSDGAKTYDTAST